MHVEQVLKAIRYAARIPVADVAVGLRRGRRVEAPRAYSRLNVVVGDGCLGAREPPLLPMLLGYGEGRFTARGLELDAACKIIS